MHDNSCHACGRSFCTQCRARLTWQWQHQAHLLLGPDQITFETIMKYSDASLSLTTVSIFLFNSSMPSFSVVFHNCVATTTRPTEHKRTEVQLQPSVLLLVPDTQSLQPFPPMLPVLPIVSLFHTVSQVLKKLSNSVKFEILPSNLIQRRQISLDLWA